MSQEASAQKQLWEAVKSGDCLRLEEAVRCGADIEAKAGNQYTPLTYAAMKGQEEVVKTLIRLGADLERMGGRWGTRTALVWAAWYGRESCVALLLEAGASLGAESLGRITPLHGAAYKGHLSVVRQLVEAGAEVNSRASDGKTPLAWACRRDIVSYLLSVGGEV